MIGTAPSSRIATPAVPSRSGRPASYSASRRAEISLDCFDEVTYSVGSIQISPFRVGPSSRSWLPMKPGTSSTLLLLKNRPVGGAAAFACRTARASSSPRTDSAAKSGLSPLASRSNSSRNALLSRARSSGVSCNLRRISARVVPDVVEGVRVAIGRPLNCRQIQ